MSEHLAAETIAAFAEGKLSRQEIAGVLAHLRRCPQCTADVEAAQPRERTSLNRWLAAAAAAVVVIGALFFFTRDRRGDMARLVALTRSDRIIEPRLSGGFGWAPYRGPARATIEHGDVDRMKLVGVAGEAADRARRDPTSDAQQTAGLAMLLAQRPEDAVALLRSAAKQSPKDAGVWSDLAAAQLVAGTQLGKASLYSEALASADQALRIDAASTAALFNRALILERLGLHAAAAAAWDRYLQTDPSSQWANEARAHRGRVPATDINIDERYRREALRVERARELVAAYPQQCRTFAEALHLGQWGEAEQRGDRGEADRLLRLARAIGAALAESSGETLLRDAVAAIDAAPDDRRRALARAHAAYYRGRLLYSKQQPTEAEALLRDAAAQFAGAGSPMSLVARYYAANAAFDRQQTAAASAELSALLSEARAHAGYVALGAQIRWELALCAMNDGAWPEALALLRDAEATFVRQHEWENAASVQSLLATTLTASGNVDDGWASRIRAFDTLSRTGARHRLLVAVGGAVRMELRDRRLDAARAMLQIEEALCRDEGNAAMSADALLRDALLSEQLGDRALAESRVSAASAAAARITDAPLRARAAADVAFARGAIRLASSPAEARRHLSQAIDAYASVQHPLFLIEAYLLRARAAWVARDGDAAVLDLERGIAELEKHPAPLAGGVVGTGVLDAGHRLYEEAIRVHLARRDDERAFAYAERARRTRVVSVDALKRLLAGTGAVILELVPIGDELVAFCVTESGLRVTRSPFDAARLASMSDADRYDLLLRPSSAALDRARTLVVVAGAPLQNVPFAALVERASGQRLVERMPVVIAPSAASLHALASSPARPKSLLAIALPSGRELSLALPDTDAEIADVARVYASAQLLAAERATLGSFTEAAGRADVIHIAGHTEQQASTDDAVFVFAGGERMSPDRLSSMSIAADGVVVLAGCNTLRASALRSLTLGDAFLAAGARAVIGTLTPIADRDARELFAAFHRQLASGLSEAEALRRVQLDAIAAGRGEAWSSLALITTAVPSTSRRIP